jgi:hypothetical protein
MLLARLRDDPAQAEVHFRELMDVLSSGNDISPRESANLIIYALNHQIRNVNQGKGDPDTIFALVDSIRAQGSLVTDQIGGPRYYKLVTLALCNLKRFEEAEAFIEEFREKIAEETRDQCYAYNKAAVAFHKGDWQQGRRLLFHIETRFKDPSYELGSRVYLCKSDFFLEDWLKLADRTEQFRIYILRQKKKDKVRKEEFEPFDMLVKCLELAVKAEPNLRRGRAGMGKEQIKYLDKLIAKMKKASNPRPIQWMMNAVKDL